jgi:hypothetical protein
MFLVIGLCALVIVLIFGVLNYYQNKDSSPKALPADNLNEIKKEATAEKAINVPKPEKKQKKTKQVMYPRYFSNLV